MSVCTIERFRLGAWERVGELHVANELAGIGSSGRFEYDIDWLDANDADLGAIDARAVSCRYPITYDVRDEERWPAFVLDVIPSGAARRYWERELALPNLPRSDWAVLVRGAGNPPGNLRIAEAVITTTTVHAGFSRDDVVARAERFLEYARERGAEVAGASGAGGDSPKLLLREDRKGRFHADGALDDAATRRSWLVKFPRSRKAIDRTVLEAEAAYYRIAQRFGIRTHGPIEWEKECLFVPRFDRPENDGRIDRLGFESLCSLSGVSDFGVPIAKEIQLAALQRFASNPRREAHEFFLRDVLDVALGNTDNHARNTAVLKDANGIALSPLYDFAPMLLDSEGIVRVCRWKDEEAGFPKWRAIAASLAIDPQPIAASVRMLPQWLDEERVPKAVALAVRPRIERTLRDLEVV